MSWIDRALTLGVLLCIALSVLFSYVYPPPPAEPFEGGPQVPERWLVEARDSIAALNQQLTVRRSYWRYCPQ